MTYKTHLAVGYAASLLIFPPKSITELISCIGVSTIGAVISDVDATTSESKKSLKTVSTIIFSAVALIIILDSFFHTSFIYYLSQMDKVMRIFSGIILFLGICIFGERQPHRSFMHSILGVIAIVLSFSIIAPSSAKYMAISMISHILIDLLNKRKIRILYPSKKIRIGFGLCYADGIVNRILFWVGFAFSAFAVIRSLIYIF